ncbi:MAG: hypothetical protein JJ891_16570 [Rhizobiaceae bacterium]|nr:hypothetical protein [Rhizobiaceae bacterium]
MKNLVVLAFAAGAISLSAISPVFADVATGKILAFDRKARIIVLEDKTVYEISDPELSMPEGLKAGDTVEITSDGEGEEGYGSITELKIVN